MSGQAGEVRNDPEYYWAGRCSYGWLVYCEGWTSGGRAVHAGPGVSIAALAGAIMWATEVGDGKGVDHHG